MSEITNVDLLYQRKARGLSPLSHFALTDDGQLFITAPDEMEARTFHIVCFEPNGKSRIVETYSVETLRKTEIAAPGNLYVGTTDDDLYLFLNSRKNRFLPDRRASYTDIALGQNGNRFGVALCDMMASSHSVALGDTAGRLFWAKDMGFSVRCIAVDRNVAYLAVGGEDGSIILLDATRTTIWSYPADSEITAIATNGASATVFGTSDGVGFLDEAGRLCWFTEIVREIIGLALSESAQTVAVLTRGDEGSGRLIFLSADGLPHWDIDFDQARPTSLTISASGQFAAVSLRDGHLCLYELQFGERMTSVNASQAIAEAAQARNTGNFAAAIELLRARLAVVPSDTASGQALVETVAALRETALFAAENSAAVGDFRLADRRLAEIVSANPHDLKIQTLRRDLRLRWANERLEAGIQALANGEAARAESSFLEAIEADPFDRRARERLSEAHRSVAENAVAEGTRLLENGQFATASEAFLRAQRFGATGPDVTALLRKARAGEALRQGVELYQNRQYAAALFQFKKVLRFDPENSEARQKAQYAQNFLQDSQINERFTRLE